MRKVTITLDAARACRTNTGRCREGEHYNLRKLISLSGADFDLLINDLQFCAEQRADNDGIIAIRSFAEALLSAFEIQASTYKMTEL